MTKLMEDVFPSGIGFPASWTDEQVHFALKAIREYDSMLDRITELEEANNKGKDLIEYIYLNYSDVWDSIILKETNRFSRVFGHTEECIPDIKRELTEKNKQLVENFQVLIHEMKQELVRGSYAVDTESGSSMVISIPAVNGEISKITRALIDDDYMNSILAKHKEQI